MTLHNPVWIHALAYDAPDFRQAISSLLNPAGGVVGSGDYQVTAPASGMSVNVAEGQIWIPGSAANQAQYYMLNDATLSVTVPAANATNPRIDLIVAQVEDAEYGSGSNLGQVVDIAGTPAPSPVAPSAPASSIVLAQVYVGAAVTSITSANITDERPHYYAAMNVGQSLQLIAVNGASAGTPPSVNGPNFKLQTGVANPTWTGSAWTLTFPEAFPNGCVCVIPFNNDALASGATPVSTNPPTSTACVINMSTASGAAFIGWIAIGF